MRKFWSVFRWILLAIVLLVVAGIYYATKAGLHTFDERFSEPMAVHAEVYGSLGGNPERALPDSLLVPLDEAINYLEENEPELSSVPAYAILLSDLYLLRGNDRSIRLRFREAIDDYFKSRQQIQYASDWYPFEKATLGNLNNLLHLSYDGSGELLKAEEHIKEAIAYYDATGNNRWIGLGRMNLARINSLRGDYDTAIKNTNLSIAAYDDLDKNHSDSTFMISAYRRRASDFALLAGLAEKRGDQAAAEEYARKASAAGEYIMEHKDLFDAEEKTYQWALLIQDVVLNWLNSPLRVRTEEIGAMLEEVEEGLEASIRPGVDPYRATHKILKGEWLLATDRSAEAEIIIREGVEQLGYSIDENWVITPKDNLQGLVLTGLMAYHRILPLLLEDGEKLALLKAQRSVAEVIQQSGKHISGDVMQSGQSNQERSIYHGTMRTALSFWSSDSIVVIDQLNFLGECQRAQILQRSLQRADLVNQLEGEEQQWLKEDEALKNNLGDLNAALSRTENEEEIIALELQVNEVKRERTVLQRTPPAGVRDNFFQLYALPQVPSLKELQTAMSPEEALIQFVEMEQTLLVLTITKDAFYVEETPSFSVWERDLEDFKESLSEDESEQFVRSSRRIYDLCLAPAVTKLPARIKHLSMITDGPLRALNLEVCLRTDTVGGSYQEMDYLLRDYSVSYDYLLASYYDNLLENTDHQLAELTVYAPSYVATSEQCQAPDEIEALNQLAHELVAKRADARLVDATKIKVRATSANSKNSFFAAHGIIDEENPMQSYLLLISDEEEDCRLAIGEIMNWTFDGTDVVLGSCTTEAGKNIGGSGILSIAQAMTVAGARSLVANTDYIKDEPASILLRLYFDHRAQGLSKSESLRRAKLAYLDLEDEKISPPMYWANTILIGHKD